MEESKSFSKTPVYYHWLLVVFIYLFIYLFIYFYLFIFSVRKILSTTLNKNVFEFKSFKALLTCRSSRRRKEEEEEIGGEGSADVLRICGGVSVCELDFNKVAKRLC